MKNLFKIIVLMAFLAPVAFGQINSNSFNCSSNFLGDYKNNSLSFKLSDNEISADFDDNSVEYSIESVNYLSGQLSERSGAICNLEIKKVGCREIIPGIALSKACYIESDIGYFIVSKDMLDSVNIIFNRFD